MKDVFSIPFPKPITQREKCEKWIKACGRPDEDFNFLGNNCTHICSKHFVGEKGPTFEHTDPIPALLHTEEQVKRFLRKRKASTQRSNPLKLKKIDVTSAAESLIELFKVTTIATVNNSTIESESSTSNLEYSARKSCTNRKCYYATSRGSHIV